MYGTEAEVADKLAALKDAGVRYVLLNILGNSRETLREFASIANLDATSPQSGSHPA